MCFIYWWVGVGFLYLRLLQIKLFWTFENKPSEILNLFWWFLNLKILKDLHQELFKRFEIREIPDLKISRDGVLKSTYFVKTSKSRVMQIFVWEATVMLVSMHISSKPFTRPMWLPTELRCYQNRVENTLYMETSYKSLNIIMWLLISIQTHPVWTLTLVSWSNIVLSTLWSCQLAL